MILKSYLISDEGFKGTFAEQAAHYDMSFYSIKNRYLRKGEYNNGRSFKKIGYVADLKVYEVFDGDEAVYAGTMKEISNHFGYQENYLRNIFSTKRIFGERYAIKFKGDTKTVIVEEGNR